MLFSCASWGNPSLKCVLSECDVFRADSLALSLLLEAKSAARLGGGGSPLNDLDAAAVALNARTLRETEALWPANPSARKVSHSDSQNTFPDDSKPTKFPISPPKKEAREAPPRPKFPQNQGFARGLIDC